MIAPAEVEERNVEQSETSAAEVEQSQIDPEEMEQSQAVHEMEQPETEPVEDMYRSASF